MTTRPLLPDLPGYRELQAMAAELSTASVEQLFASEAQRCKHFTLTAAGLSLDYSKQLLTSQALNGLLQLANAAGLAAEIAALFAGEHLNNTEDRPALHTLLRAATGAGLEHKFGQVQEARTLMQSWSERINSGAWQGFSGSAITDVVNIGIGGSDLGP